MTPESHVVSVVAALLFVVVGLLLTIDGGRL